MYKLLLVEDEKWIRLGLKAMILAQRYGIAEILEAPDAEQGFALFMEQRPHIVISDVRLPGEDGCTMCENIYREAPETKIIMVSGYNEFEYARRALGYRAVDFLLKPVDKQLLNQVVGQCVEELDKRRWSGNQDDADAGLRALCVSYAENPGDSAIEKRFDQAVRERFGIFYDFAAVLVGCEEEEKSAAVSTLSAMASEVDAFRDSVVFPLPDGVCLLLFRQYNLIGRRSIARHVLRRLGEVCPRACVAVSHFYDIAKEFGKALEQTRELMAARQKGERILMGRDVEISSDMAVFYHYRKRLLESIKLRDGQAVRALSDELKADLTKQKYRPQLVQVALSGLISELSYKFLAEDEQQSELVLERISAANRGLEAETSAEGMVELVNALALDMVESMELVGSARDVIANAVRQIDENYHKKLTLRQLAGDCYMSEAYFSSLFKKTMGVSLIQYLIDVRVKRAKELLERTDLKVNEVAELVGYPDQHYFTKVFKRVTGENPTDYKERCGHNEE